MRIEAGEGNLRNRSFSIDISMVSVSGNNLNVQSYYQNFPQLRALHPPCPAHGMTEFGN
jgi:hypothetical protein